MLARVFSGATIGMNSILIEVEVDIPNQGFPAFSIVGLPGKAIKEACERVRSAIKNSGFSFPNKRITVNLTPANLPKEGPAYDLPIALGILVASDQLPSNLTEHIVFGELSLDGSLRHTNGALLMAILAKDKKLSTVILPEKNAQEAAMISGVNIIPVANLHQLADHMIEVKPIMPQPVQPICQIREIDYAYDMSDIKGQEQAKRVLEIAAAGGHNVLMIGSPGAGKTLLARTMPSILPAMTEAEILEVTTIYSIAGKLSNNNFAILERPFRSPHHTISMPGLIGGGSHPQPGEVSLAHRGVLFLDEFLEFSRIALEGLRQPLEDGVVTVSRVAGSVEFPARVILIAAANPCPCGYLFSKRKHCTCLPGMVQKYQKRISGPILDRIDLHLTVPEVEIEKLDSTYKSETSDSIRARVEVAKTFQQQRFSQHSSMIFSNAELTSKLVQEYCPLSMETKQLLQKAAQSLSLSARSYYRIIKIARTIADLSQSENILSAHIAEALQYRPQTNH